MRYRLEPLEGASVLVEGARQGHPDDVPDFTVALGPGELRPGLINAHDHLHRNHYPRLGAPPYEDAYAWGRDIHERWAGEIERGRALERRTALLFGALKNLLAGVTTVVHHDPWEAAFDDAFPVRIAPVRAVHSLGFEPALSAAWEDDRELPLCIHLAEGTTADAADEVRVLDDLGLVDDRLVAVHAVGVDDDGAARLLRAGAAVTWCPTSNAFLFGRTAPRAVLTSGMDVMIGSDSLLTGAGTLLDELAAARALGLLPDRALLDGVGRTAARRLRLPPPELAPGAPADLVHLGRSPLEASAEDVQLVVVGGLPRLGDERFLELFERCAVEVERLRVGRTTKLVAAPLAAVAERVITDWPEAGRILATQGGPRRAG